MRTLRHLPRQRRKSCAIDEGPLHDAEAGGRADAFAAPSGRGGLRGGAESRGGHLTEDELIARLPGVSATIAAGEPCTERVFAAARDLRLVSRRGVGYDNVDLAAASHHGVAVADLTLSLICVVRRQLLQNDRSVRQGRWRAECMPGLWQAAVGMVGLGRIGRRVVKRCLGFGMRILAAEPKPDLEFVRRHGIGRNGGPGRLRRLARSVPAPLSQASLGSRG